MSALPDRPQDSTDSIVKQSLLESLQEVLRDSRVRAKRRDSRLLRVVFVVLRNGPVWGPFEPASRADPNHRVDSENPQTGQAPNKPHDSSTRTWLTTQETRAKCNGKTAK